MAIYTAAFVFPPPQIQSTVSFKVLNINGGRRAKAHEQKPEHRKARRDVLHHEEREAPGQGTRHDEQLVEPFRAEEAPRPDRGRGGAATVLTHALHQVEVEVAVEHLVGGAHVLPHRRRPSKAQHVAAGGKATAHAGRRVLSASFPKAV